MELIKYILWIINLKRKFMWKQATDQYIIHQGYMLPSPIAIYRLGTRRFLNSVYWWPIDHLITNEIQMWTLDW